jgi:predicted RNase H-like HicB family nuclease
MKVSMRQEVDRSAITPEELEQARNYAMVIEWSPDDAAFVVSVPDLQGLHTHGSTREAAAAMGEEAIVVWLAADRNAGLPAPPPTFTALPPMPRTAGA